MAELDWDSWNLSWSQGLPKNEMWSKIRSGGTDESGEPTYRYAETSDKSSVDAAVAEVLADHHFVAPALDSSPGDEHCFCGWSGPSWMRHRAVMLDEFSGGHLAAAAEAALEALNDPVSDVVEPEPEPVKKPARRGRKTS